MVLDFKMTYKEVLLFVGKCLTLSHEEHNRKLIEKQLQLDTIDWNLVVRFCTAQLVFPALYCNLKRANFLQYLPNDLVELMEYITDLNRTRNEKIITQAKEINEILLANNITPIFLKGTGNLLEGLYEDIAERMLSDIDFIVSPEELDKTAAIFNELNYIGKPRTNSNKDSRHLRPLTHSDKISSVEIHFGLIREPYTDEFDYNFIARDFQIIEGIHLLSFKNQLSLSIIAEQINDLGVEFNAVSLRNAYDVFLLSKKTNAKNAFDQFHRIKNPLNCFLAASFQILNEPKSLQYQTTKETKKYLDTFNLELDNAKLREKRRVKIRLKRYIKNQFRAMNMLFFDKIHRASVYKQVTEKGWAKKKYKHLALLAKKLYSTTVLNKRIY
jgi:hypothetical protein